MMFPQVYIGHKIDVCPLSVTLTLGSHVNRYLNNQSYGSIFSTFSGASNTNFGLRPSWQGQIYISPPPGAGYYELFNLIKHVNGKLLLLFTIAKITIQNKQHLQN